MLVVAIFVFLAAEVGAFVLVAHQIGFLWALIALLGASALGPFVVKRAGLGILARTQDRLAQGELPTRELLDGLVVLIGGLMLCLPGFIGDALGLLLMVGPARHLVIRLAGGGLARRVQAVRPGRWRIITATARPSGPRRPPGSPVPPIGPGTQGGAD